MVFFFLSLCYTSIHSSQQPASLSSTGNQDSTLVQLLTSLLVHWAASHCEERSGSGTWSSESSWPLLIALVSHLDSGRFRPRIWRFKPFPPLNWLVERQTWACLSTEWNHSPSIISFLPLSIQMIQIIMCLFLVKNVGCVCVCVWWNT